MKVLFWFVILSGLVLFVSEPARGASEISLRRSGIHSSFSFTVAGGPTAYSVKLSVPPNLRAPFAIDVRHPAEVQRRVSHVRMLLNHTQIIDTSDFANGVTILKRSITLEKDNSFRVEVDGLNQSFIWVSFTGTPDHEHVDVFSETFRLFAPERERTETRTFPANRYIDPPFEMIVMPSVGYRDVPVRIRSITLNGKEIFTEKDFEQDASYVIRPIELLPENNLEIKDIKGTVGNVFNVIIRGQRTPLYPGLGGPAAAK